MEIRLENSSRSWPIRRLPCRSRFIKSSAGLRFSFASPEVHNNAANSSDLAFDLELIGEPRPLLVVVSQFPAAGNWVSSLTSMEVAFSEAVSGGDAFGLLVNGVPTTNLIKAEIQAPLTLRLEPQRQP